MITEEFRKAFTERLDGTFDPDSVKAIFDELEELYDVRKATEVREVQCRNGDTIQEYLDTKAVEGCSEGTINNYRNILRKFMAYTIKDLSEIEANDVRKFLKDYKDEHGCSDRTLNKYREFICWFFKWCHMEGKLTSCPTRNLKPIRHEEKERKALSRLEMELMRSACADQRERAILEFLYSTAFRVSELCNVRKSDVNLRERTVRIVGKGKKERTSWINDKCYLELTQYLAERDDDSEFLFVNQNAPHGQCRKESIERMIKRIQSRTGGEISFRVSPHIIRHTSATHALSSGMDIARIQHFLGHSQINTTMRYAHVSTEDVQAAHRRYVV